MGSISFQNLRSSDVQGTMRRLMRPQSLTIVATTLQYTALAVAALCLVLSAYWIINSVLTSRSASLTLQNRIQHTIALGKEQSRPTRSPDATNVIVQRAIFGPLTKASIPAAGPTPPPATPLSLTLIGTFLTGGDQPYAIIEDKKKQTQDVFIVSQSIFNQANLKAIFEDRVEITRDGKVEVLRLDDMGGDAGPSSGAGVASTGTDEFIVEEAEVDKALENLPLLLTQARAVPYFKDGRAVGLRLFAIKTGSLYEKIGMKNGDILKAINGNSLADLSQALRLFEQLKQERSINVVLERDRSEREFRYQIR